MEKLKYVAESNYKFKLDGSIIDWFLLSLA